jgi:DNA-binding response OmpR family regulator
MAERQLRVLIVDDDQLQLELMERSLRIEGFQVATSSSVFGVSNIMRSFEPDVMLIDVHIPALSGDQLLGLARRNAPDTTRFVLYSSCDEWRLKSLAKDTNADGWISKSADAAQVAKKLREVCAQVSQRPDATPHRTEPPPNRSDAPPPWQESMQQRLDASALRTDPPPFRTDPVLRQKTDPPTRVKTIPPPTRAKTIPPPTRNSQTDPPPRPSTDPPPRQRTEPPPPPPRNKTEPPPG